MAPKVGLHVARCGPDVGTHIFTQHVGLHMNRCPFTHRTTCERRPVHVADLAISVFMPYDVCRMFLSCRLPARSYRFTWSMWVIVSHDVRYIGLHVGRWPSHVTRCEQYRFICRTMSFRCRNFERTLATNSLPKIRPPDINK